jgi:hypothetical protein
MVKPRSSRPFRLALAGSVLVAIALPAGSALADPPVGSAPPPAASSAAAKDAPAKGAPEKQVASSPPADAPVVASARDPVMQKAADSRRSGLAINLSFGNGIASVVGYPNDAQKVGYARYYHASGARPGGVTSLWIGGAITDWFVFGVGFSGGGLQFTGDTTVSSGGTIFHAEVFPLYYRGGAWRDVGLMLDAGLGTATVVDDGTKVKQVDVSTATRPRPPVPFFTQPKDKLVDSGSASLIGAGVFYEAAKIWRVRIAPFVYANYIWSDTVRRPGIFLGVHSTFYWKPTKD